MGDHQEMEKRQLPKSPSKRVEAVMGLVQEVGLKLKESDFNRNWKKYGGLSNQVKSQVVDLYYQTNVINTAPGLKDKITVWIEKENEMMRKYYPDKEIGFTMFIKLRPKNVPLLKNKPIDQCKCSLYENFCFKLEAPRISFWPKVLCCSENYNSECWRGECDECMNGKNISFPDILDNENLTYKEWGQNDHKHLSLYTKECQVNELKETLLEGFKIYQKHGQAKSMMYATFEKDKLDPNCMLMQVDFARACSCKYQNDIQFALWSHRSANLFTAATYNAEGKEESFLILTNSSGKAKNSVHAFMFKLIDEMTVKGERELIVYSFLLHQFHVEK